MNKPPPTPPSNNNIYKAGEVCKITVLNKVINAVVVENATANVAESLFESFVKVAYINDGVYYVQRIPAAFITITDAG